ncbi:MAG TPA: MBL fold metallo-hydrolase [Pyrinomonadaceae bacterium]
MIVQRFVLTPFQQNTRVVACSETLEAICIDPGEESGGLVRFIETEGLKLKAIALTHGHLDHVGGTSALHARFPNAEILIHAEEEELYYGLPQQPLFMGISPDQLAMLGFVYDDPPKISRNWVDGETYGVGNLRFKVLHCPGHTRGHVVLVEDNHRAVFVGDCLFAGSIGRTDLPGGSYEELMDSLRNRVMALGDDFTVYSGHGPETTIGRERVSNPFLNGTYRIGMGKYF